MVLVTRNSVVTIIGSVAFSGDGGTRRMVDNVGGSVENSLSVVEGIVVVGFIVTMVGGGAIVINCVVVVEMVVAVVCITISIELLTNAL